MKRVSLFLTILFFVACVPENQTQAPIPQRINLPAAEVISPANLEQITALNTNNPLIAVLPPILVTNNTGGVFSGVGAFNSISLQTYGGQRITAIESALEMKTKQLFAQKYRVLAQVPERISSGLNRNNNTNRHPIFSGYERLSFGHSNTTSTSQRNENFVEPPDYLVAIQYAPAVFRVNDFSTLTHSCQALYNSNDLAEGFLNAIACATLGNSSRQIDQGFVYQVWLTLLKTDPAGNHRELKICRGFGAANAPVFSAKNYGTIRTRTYSFVDAQSFAAERALEEAIRQCNH